MELKLNLLKKLEFLPMALFDLTKEELKAAEQLIQENKIEKFIDNGTCIYPMGTLHKDAYYIRIKN